MCWEESYNNWHYFCRQGFVANQNRARNLADKSVLPDLCTSHRRQLLVMLKNHQSLRDIKRRCTAAKEELSANLHTRLRLVQHSKTSNHDHPDGAVIRNVCICIFLWSCSWKYRSHSWYLMQTQTREKKLEGLWLVARQKRCHDQLITTRRTELESNLVSEWRRVVKSEPRLRDSVLLLVAFSTMLKLLK